MAINFTDFSRAPLLESPFKNALENVLKGYQISQEPAKMAEEQKKRQLTNQLKEFEVENKPKDIELNNKYKELTNSMKGKALENYDELYNLNKQLKQAQINKANRPAQVGGALSNALQLRNQYPEGTPERKIVDQYINKLSTPKEGVQISSTPEGGFQVNLGGNKEQTAQIPGFPKLGKDEIPVYDKQGKPLAIGKPYTQAEKKEYSGRETFNTWQKFVTDAMAPYSGQGSNAAFLNDIRDYSKDSEAKKRIDNLIAAEKLVFSTTVKEAATLGSANTNRAYQKIQKSLTDSEIFPKLRNIAQYRLPRGYSKASSDLMREKINEGTKAGQNIPAFNYYYLNPQKQNSVEFQDDNALSNSLTNNNPKKFKSGFKSESEFNNYYKSLSEEDRKLYRQQLAEKNNV